jgi:uncharacterized protein YggE
MRALLIALLASITTPALGQTSPIEPRTIDVSGHGKVTLPPDTANIHYWIRGEGRSSDDATRAMADSKGRVESGLRAFLGTDSQITNNDLVIIEVRDPNCKVENGRAALSEGQCAIIGYVAQIQTDVRTSSVAKAGTAVGLAGRLGARDARLQGFELRDTAKAREEAMTRAVNDARAQAQILAAAAGGHLGRAVRIQYGSYGMLPMVRGTMFASAPPPPPPPPPVEVEMKPRPEEVSADVNISYELL